MARALPLLYYRHRGYFMVVLSIGICHTFAAVDELLPYSDQRHNLPAWTIHNQLASHSVWGVTHALAAVLTVVGLYHANNDMFLIRVVSALSASIFMLMAITSLISVIHAWPNGPLTGTGLYLFVMLCSVASLLEPGINPANYHDTGE